jgi:hypothetical protein
MALIPGGPVTGYMNVAMWYLVRDMREKQGRTQCV